MRNKDYQELREALGVGLLCHMTGLSARSLRELPKWKNISPSLRGRLKFLGEVIQCLEGSYNSEGIKKWFCRSRDWLDNRAPIYFLDGRWKPSDPAPQKILARAKSLTRPGDAT